MISFKSALGFNAEINAQLEAATLELEEIPTHKEHNPDKIKYFVPLMLMGEL